LSFDLLIERDFLGADDELAVEVRLVDRIYRIKILRFEILIL
jgi:hypothetical protein